VRHPGRGLGALPRKGGAIALSGRRGRRRQKGELLKEKSGGGEVGPIEGPRAILVTEGGCVAKKLQKCMKKTERGSKNEKGTLVREGR